MRGSPNKTDLKPSPLCVLGLPSLRLKGAELLAPTIGAGLAHVLPVPAVPSQALDTKPHQLDGNAHGRPYATKRLTRDRLSAVSPVLFSSETL